MRPIDTRTREWKIKHHIGSLIRKICSASRGRLSDSSHYKNGLEAHIVTRDDFWLLESVVSTSKYISNYIVVDSSNDFFSKYNRALLEHYAPGKYTYIKEDVDQKTARQIAHKISTYEYIMHLDGDMVAVDRGWNSAEDLFKRLKGLPTIKYYDIYFPLLFIGDDLTKIQKVIYGYEDWIYSNSSDFRWSNARLDLPRIPLYYRKLLWDKPYFVHLNHIVDEEKYFKKLTTVMWQRDEVRQKFGNFQNFLQSIKESNTFSAADIQYLEYREEYGMIPSLLDRFANLSRQEIISVKKKEISGLIMPY